MSMAAKKTVRLNGIIATAVGNDLLIAHPLEPLDGVGAAMLLAGPALYLLGENLFRGRMSGPLKAERLTAAVLLLALLPLGTRLSALLLSAVVATVLTALAVVELRTRRHRAAAVH